MTANGQIQKVPVRELTAGRTTRMRKVAENYYREPDTGLSDELRCGNLVYFIEADDGAIGCFLIVDFDHHRTIFNHRYYRFTISGLGVRHRLPSFPCSGRSKATSPNNSPKALSESCISRRGPHLLTMVSNAPSVAISFQPARDNKSPKSIRMVRYIREAIHNQPLVSDRDNPFLLREVKKGPFNPQEIARIASSRGDTPISKMGVRCDGRDEVIVFHTFVA